MINAKIRHLSISYSNPLFKSYAGGLILTGTGAFFLHQKSATASEAAVPTSSAGSRQRTGIIETDFTDKIAAKPYLNYLKPA